MPPEPFPWDRRDFRKHERSGSDPRFGGGYGGGGPPRWREQHHANAPPSQPPSYHHHQQQQLRWYSDFRSRPLPPGHGKQAGWHMHSDEAVHGFPPYASRLSDRNVAEDNYRPFGSFSEGGRHFRNNRENRGSFSQKYWREETPWEPFSTPNVPGRSSENNDQRFLENTQSGTNDHVDNNCKEDDNSFNPPPDMVNPSDHSQSIAEIQRDKDDENAEGLTGTVKIEKENLLGSINWKPLKWSRSGSLSSKGSSLSRSSSSKSMGVDSIETAAEVQPKKVTPVQSPTSDTNAGVVTYAPVPSEETSSRKKLRLGWGEGLAKYEKKKIDGPEDNVIKTSRVMRIGIGEESVQSHTMNLLDNSPRVSGFLDCTSPATPSSVAFSSSPGIEEKGFMKATDVIHDASNFSCSPNIISKSSYEGPSLNLENMEHSSLASISSLISLQSDHPCPGEAYHVEVNKLLLWTSDITKVLEKTEYEIDLLETELKLLISEPSKGFPFPDPSSAQLEEPILKPCEEHAIGIDSTLGLGCLEIVSSGDTHVENISVAVEDKKLRLTAENIDGPPCELTCVDVSRSGDDSYPNQVAQVIVNLDVNNSSYLDGDCQDTYLHADGNTECVGCHELTATASCQDISGDFDMYCDTSDVYGSILASNKDLMNGASDTLNKLLPSEWQPCDVMPKFCASSLKSHSPVVKNNFLLKKRFLQFKEKVLTIKYKLFQHFWVQGQIVSVRKLRALSHKKFDLIRHKQHCYGRTRISGSASNSRTVSPEDVIDVVRHLLSESHLKPCRNALRMPALMLDKKALQIWRFMPGNGIVEDPCAFEKERSVINSWTIEESETFIDKLAIFGKDFRKIASFLDHKTTADCVEFYYKNHKSDCFERVRKKSDVMKQSKSQCTTYMVASGNRRTREAATCSLDMLGAASAIVATADARAEICQKSTPKVCFDVSNAYKTPRSYDGPLKRSNSPDLYSSEIETVAADVLAGICGSLSSEAISSCITSSVDHGDGYHDRRYQRVGFCSKPPFTSEATHSVDDECSDESCGELDPTDWNNGEKSLFMQALSSYGKDFEMISQCVGTRSRNQCIVFYSKARKCLSLDMIHSQPGIAVYGYVNGGSSDVEDASVLETGSIVCNEVLDCKIEEHLLHPDMNFGCESDIIEGKTDKDHGNLSSVVHMDTEPVLQSLLIDNEKCSDKHVLDFDVDVNGKIGVDGVSVSVKKLGTITVSPNAESVQRVEAPDECGLANGSTNAVSMAFVEVSDGSHEKNSDYPKKFSSTKKVERIDVNCSDANDMNWAVSMNSDSEPAGNISHLATTVYSTPQVDISECQMRGNLGYSSTENSHVGSLLQNDQIESLKCSTLFSVPIKYQNLSNDNVSSPVGVIGSSDGRSLKIAKTGCHTLSDIESSQILRGYPVPVPIVNEEINSCLSSKLQVPLHLVPSPDERFRADRRVEVSLQKCSNSGHYCEDSSLPLHEQTTDKSTPLPFCSSDMEKTSKTGDVKLFGKILTSSQQISNSCGQQKSDNNSRDQKSGCPSADLKFSGEQVNSDAAMSKLDCSKSLGSENNPFMNFGFWDGNRMRTGLPPLPDSALLLAKYPAAFSNYAKATAKVEQPALQGVVKSNDHSLNGVSVFPSREFCSSTEFVKNREVQQSFTIDMKNPGEALISEMQRRNVFNVVSGMQHQSRGGIIGRGGVGGHCSGVSDPVAAIKMHYANADRFCLQTGNIIKEEDTWSSKGDIGR